MVLSVARVKTNHFPVVGAIQLPLLPILGRLVRCARFRRNRRRPMPTSGRRRAAVLKVWRRKSLPKTNCRTVVLLSWNQYGSDYDPVECDAIRDRVDGGVSYRMRSLTIGPPLGLVEENPCFYFKRLQKTMWEIPFQLQLQEQFCWSRVAGVERMLWRRVAMPATARKW